MSPSERASFEEVVNLRSRSIGMAVSVPTFRPNSLLALEAAEAARAEGLFDAYRSAIFEAYWVKNLNISRVEVLQTVATDVGVNIAQWREALRVSAYMPIINAAVAEVEPIRRKVLPLFRRGKLVMLGLPRDYSRLRHFIERSDPETP